MLNYIRSRAQGWVAWVIVGIITVPFALWGIHNYVGGGGPTYLAKVGDAEIGQARFEETYQQQRQQFMQMFGGELPEMFSEQMLRAQVLEQMIEQEVLVQQAIEQKMRISNRQLAQVIRGVEVFHDNGAFSQERYVDILRRQAMTPAGFEQRLYRDLLAEQMESAFLGSAFTTTAQLDQMLRLDLQQRELSWLQIPANDFIAQLDISDAEIEQWYQANQERFQTPEQVRLDYLELRAEDFFRDIDVDEEELRIRYESRIDTYRSPEERRASHILVQIEDSPSDAQVRSARQRAEQILARIRDGEDFATLAVEESDDTGSAAQGGDLGFFGRGVMVASFEDVAFAMEEGQVSELVRSPFGFHIIRLEEVRGGEVKPFAELRDDLERELRQEIGNRRFLDAFEELASYTYEQPDTLSTAAEELGLPIQTSDVITRQGGPGIGSHGMVVQAAFSDDVLQREVNSDPIEITRDHVVVLRVNEHQPAAVRPLDEVRDDVIAVLQRERSTELARELAGRVKAAVDDGQVAMQAAEAFGYRWSVPSLIERDNRELNPMVLDTAFNMPRPAQGGHAMRLVEGNNGDQFLIKLHQVVDGDPAQASEQQRQRVEEMLLRAEANVVANGMLASMRERTDITIRRQARD